MKRATLVLVGSVIVACGGGSTTPPTQPTAPPTPPATVASLAIGGPGCVNGLCGGAVGGTVQLTATATLSDGSTQDVTGRAQWSSLNTDVAIVNTSGLVSFRAAGDADIASAYQGAGARATVRPVSCSYTPEVIAPLNAAGGSGTLAVRVESNCRWNALTNDSWIRIDNPGSPSGPLPVAFTVDPNRSFSGRAGGVEIRGEYGNTLASYAVTQHAAGCLYSIDQALLTLTWMGTYDGAGDGPVAVRVHAQPSDCQWTATSSVSWTKIVYNSARGTGDGTIYVSLVFWNDGPTRSGDIRIAGLSGVNPDAHMVVTQTGR